MAEAETNLVRRARMLGERLAAQRLSRNLTQRQLSEDAGVGINTLRRLEAGENASLDTLLRVIDALGLGNRIETLAPPVDIRPVDRVRLAAATERRRATGAGAKPAEPWTWGDDE